MKVLKEEVIFESFSLTWISVEFLLSLGGEQQAKWVCQWLSSKWSAKKYEEGRRRILLQQTAVYHSTLLHSRSAHTQPTSISSCPHISLVFVFSFKDIGCTHHNLTYVALSVSAAAAKASPTELDGSPIHTIRGCLSYKMYSHLSYKMYSPHTYTPYTYVYTRIYITGDIFDIKCIHHTQGSSPYNWSIEQITSPKNNSRKTKIELFFPKWFCALREVGLFLQTIGWKPLVFILLGFVGFSQCRAWREWGFGNIFAKPNKTTVGSPSQPLSDSAQSQN